MKYHIYSSCFNSLIPKVIYPDAAELRPPRSEVGSPGRWNEFEIPRRSNGRRMMAKRSSVRRRGEGLATGKNEGKPGQGIFFSPNGEMGRTVMVII